MSSDYETGYQDGDSANQADWRDSLDGVLPADVEPWPTLVATHLATLIDELGAARAELAALRQRIETLHQRVTTSENAGFCTSCDHMWPCPTIAALAGAAPTGESTE